MEIFKDSLKFSNIFFISIDFRDFCRFLEIYRFSWISWYPGFPRLYDISSDFCHLADFLRCVDSLSFLRFAENFREISRFPWIHEISKIFRDVLRFATFPALSNFFTIVRYSQILDDVEIFKDFLDLSRFSKSFPRFLRFPEIFWPSMIFDNFRIYSKIFRFAEIFKVS